MGIGGEPASEVPASQGRVRATRLSLDVDAAEGGFTGKLSKTTRRRLPVHLPVRVYELNPNRPAAVYHRTRNELVPFGISDGIGGASIDLDRGDADVWIGNLVTCDHPALRLTVLEESPEKDGGGESQPH